MPEELIRLEDVCMAYNNEPVLNSINLSIRKNEFLTILGPSGCGKTTTLRLIAGFEIPVSGVIYYDGAIINDIPPYKRPVNTVFQRYALFPHMNVFENVAFGLRLRKEKNGVIEEKVRSLLKMVNLSGYEKRASTKLSGGEQQRVAIARALVNEPQVLLLDEPLGALDLKLRKGMQTELKRMQRKLGITFVYVTHDQEEALTMSDTIVVMNKGVIQQVGSPTDIYNEPRNAFVADFIGESNIVKARMVCDRLVEFSGMRFECIDEGFGRNVPVQAVIRPEDLKIVPIHDSQMFGFVESVVFKGVHYEMEVTAECQRWLIHSTIPEQIGTRIGMRVAPMDIHIMKEEAEL